jgi:hypothetical protein
MNMIVDRCDRPSFYTKSLTESIKNPAGVKDGSGCKVVCNKNNTLVATSGAGIA